MTAARPRYAPDARPRPTLERQAVAIEVAAENWWPLFNYLSRTAEAKAWANFDIDLTLKTAAGTLKRLAALARATSDDRVEEWLRAAEAKTFGTGGGA